MALAGGLALRLKAWGRDLVEMLRVLVLEDDKLLALGPLAISSLLTAEILDWPPPFAGDCGALQVPGTETKQEPPPPPPCPCGVETEPARERLRPLRGMVLSPLAPPPPPFRLPPLSREKQSYWGVPPWWPWALPSELVLLASCSSLALNRRLLSALGPRCLAIAALFGQPPERPRSSATLPPRKESPWLGWWSGLRGEPAARLRWSRLDFRTGGGGGTPPFLWEKKPAL